MVTDRAEKVRAALAEMQEDQDRAQGTPRWRVCKRRGEWADPDNLWTVRFSHWWTLSADSDAACVENGQFPDWETAMRAARQAIASWRFDDP